MAESAAGHLAGAGLGRLIGDARRASFYEQDWETGPFVVRRSVPADEVDSFLEATVEYLTGSAAAGHTSLVCDGMATPVDPDRSNREVLFSAYSAGRTILATQVERASPLVAEVCRSLDLEFLSHGVPIARAVSANAYLTPSGTQGFDLHFDDHCAFVLQLRGTKQWVAFEPAEKLPLGHCEHALPPEEAGPAVIDCLLQPGDVLYLPRGWPHSARADDASSLHLTFSVRTVTRAEALGVEHHPEESLRRSLTPMASIAPGPGPAVADRRRLEGFRQRRLVQSLSKLAPLASDRFAAIDDSARIGLGTTVRRIRQMTCLSFREGGESVICFPGSLLRLPDVMSPVLDFISQTAEFTPGDLPLIAADYDRLELTRHLIGRGLLAAVVPDGPARAPDLTLHRRSGPDVDRHLDWLSTRTPLTRSQCESIVEVCQAFPVIEATTVGQEQVSDQRRVLARQVGRTEKSSWFLEFAEGLAAEASSRHYGLDLAGLVRPPQYLEYRPGEGHFERHNDYSHEQPEAPRKLTLIFQLSDPADYDGGLLQVHGIEPEELPADRGAVVVFPSFLYHSVSPVNRGVRRALVAWVGGPRLR